MSGPHPGYPFTGRMDNWARRYGTTFWVEWYDENAKLQQTKIEVPGPEASQYETY